MNRSNGFAVAQTLGLVLFLASGGAIFQNISIRKIELAVPGIPADEIESLIAGTTSQAYQSLTKTEKAAVITQVTSAMSNVWLFFMVAAALSFVCSLPLFVGLPHHVVDVLLTLEQKTKVHPPGPSH